MKKCKRTLSLLLALIMICSAMGIVAFAAENGDGGHEYYFSGTGSFNMSFTAHGTDVVGSATLRFSGVWNNTEQALSWSTCAFTFSGSNADKVEYERDYSREESEYMRAFKVYFIRNNDDPIYVYKAVLQFNEDDRSFSFQFNAIVNGVDGVNQYGTLNYTIED